MSVVELRRNSSPHLGTLPLSQSSPVWRKSSHPPLSAASATSPPCRVRVASPSTHGPLTGAELARKMDDIRSTRNNNKFDDEAMDLPSARDGTVSPGVYHRMLYHSEDQRSLVYQITQEAKELIHAETCSLFVLDNENKELVAKVFDNADKLSEIRLPMDKGVVGRVATTRTLMNVRDVSRCPFFYEKVDELTGFRTRNILCLPIVDNAGTFVGVIELCNRVGRSAFSRPDELRARTFAVYCATSISHCLLYHKVQEAQRRTHMAAELLVQGSTHLVNDDEVKALAAAPIRPWQAWHSHFDRFHFSPRSIGGSDQYMHASITMFDDLGFIRRYRMSKKKVASFVLRVARGYRDVPYHNWSHAFAVAHFCWLTLRTSVAKFGLDEMEQLALLIACLCHDIDHRGTNNAFQLQTKTPLAQLYSSEGSVLERHHYSQTVQILKEADCNILEELTRTQYQLVLNHIRDIILATDIAVHIKKVHRIQTMVDVGYDRMSHDHHYLFTCLIMTASDLSDQSKNFNNSKSIAENIYREFFCQGDLEKQMGAKPMEMMDRERARVPKIQLDFMDTVALPVFDMLAHIVPEGRSTHEAIQHNRRCWAALDDLLKDEEKPLHGLDYLHDEQLEKRVIERVGHQPSALNNNTNMNHHSAR